MLISPSEITISPDMAIREAMLKLNGLGKKFAHTTLLVIGTDGLLIGGLTDGDIRRALLNGSVMESKVKDICNKKPIVAPEGLPVESMRQIISMNRIDNLPVVDNQGKVVSVMIQEPLDHMQRVDQKVVLMAGGKGERLRPLTDSVPKPMLKIDNKPLLQIIIESMREYGFMDFYISLNFLSEVIQDYFKDGSWLNVSISYLIEDKALGTAGCLSLLNGNMKPAAPFLVMNGDLLTALNFKSFKEFHIAAGYDLTLCGSPYEIQLPFGYPVIEGDIVIDFKEKPVFTHLINSGVYCISPNILEFVPANEYFTMPELILAAIKNKKRVGVFPLREAFHEIGRPESFTAAEDFYKKHFKRK